MGKIGIIIPCYNVESTVEKVLRSLSDQVVHSIDEFLAIDNNSSDRTLEVLNKFQKNGSPISKKLTIIVNSENYNYGGSIKIGLRYFVGKKAESVIIVHSDNQGNTDQIIRNFLPISGDADDVDLIITSRFAKGSNLAHYSKIRILANYFFTFLTFIVTGLRMSDSGSALIRVKTRVLERLPFFELTNGLHFHPQLNILIYGNKKFRIREIPITWSDSEIGSNVRLVHYGLSLLKILLLVPIRKLLLGKSGVDLFLMNDRGFSPKFEVFHSGVPKSDKSAGPLPIAARFDGPGNVLLV